MAIFGASRLPKMARSLGEGIREFRTALHDASNPTAAENNDADRGPAANTAVTERPAGKGEAGGSTP